MNFFDSSGSASYCTSVRLMKSDVMMAKTLGIKLTKAFQLGLKILVDLEIENGRKTVDPALLESWKNTREKEIEEIFSYLSSEKKKMETIKNIVNTHKEIEKKQINEKFWVIDKEYGRILVTEDIFDPRVMVKVES